MKILVLGATGGLIVSKAVEKRYKVVASFVPKPRPQILPASSLSKATRVMPPR